MKRLRTLKAQVRRVRDGVDRRAVRAPVTHAIGEDTDGRYWHVLTGPEAIILVPDNGRLRMPLVPDSEASDVVIQARD